MPGNSLQPRSGTKPGLFVPGSHPRANPGVPFDKLRDRPGTKPGLSVPGNRQRPRPGMGTALAVSAGIKKRRNG